MARKMTGSQRQKSIVDDPLLCLPLTDVEVNLKKLKQQFFWPAGNIQKMQGCHVEM